MSIQVLGISGSPILDSNTDRAVKSILEHTGLRTFFVKLSQLEFSPCRACLGCVNSNQCVVSDDARPLADLFHETPAFVLGAYTPYSSLDARSKAFMERMYCHRHRVGRNSGKVGVSVITTACGPDVPNLPAAAQTTAAQIAFWMMEEGMENLGSMVVHGNLPCIRCGRGDACRMSGIKLIFGPQATVESVGVSTFEEDLSVLETAQELGEKIRRAVLAGAGVEGT